MDSNELETALSRAVAAEKYELAREIKASGSSRLGGEIAHLTPLDLPAC